jgi:hypothetical protein
MSRRSPGPPQLDAAHASGWSVAMELLTHLAGGGELIPQPESPVRLHPGELLYADVAAEYSRFYGTDVQYRSSSFFAFGRPAFLVAGLAVNAMANHAARTRAMAAAAAQWREYAWAPTIVTQHRTMCLVEGVFLEFPHSAVLMVAPDPSDWSVYLTLNGVVPLRLRGPAVPWLSVVLMALLEGTSKTLQHPGFEGLRRDAGLTALTPGTGFDLTGQSDELT